MQEPTRDHGTQPFDSLMTRWGLSNHSLVESSIDQLNHKQVQKARKGRQLTLRMMQKITQTLNEAIFQQLDPSQREAFIPYFHRHLFNYAKGYDSNWSDPNESLMPKE